MDVLILYCTVTARSDGQKRHHNNIIHNIVVSVNEIKVHLQFIDLTI